MLTLRGTHKSLSPAATFGQAEVAAYTGLGKELYESGRELEALKSPYAFLKEKHDMLDALKTQSEAIFKRACIRVHNAVTGQPLEQGADAAVNQLAIPAGMEPWELEKAAQMAAAEVLARKEAIEIKFPSAEARRAETIAAKGHPGIAAPAPIFNIQGAAVQPAQ